MHSSSCLIYALAQYYKYNVLIDHFNSLYSTIKAYFKIQSGGINLFQYNWAFILCIFLMSVFTFK